MSGVGPSEIQALVSSLTRGDGEHSPLAPSTIGNIYSWTASIFKDAELNRVIPRSPCQKIKLPTISRAKVVPMEVETVQALAEAVPDRYRALIFFGAGTGVRVSEALGLTVDRLDLEGGFVRIDRQLVKVVEGKPVFGPLKDRQNRPRTIPLGHSTIAALKEHLKVWPPGDDGLVFTNERGQPIRRTTFSDIWRKAAGPLGVKKGDGYHELRHFYASLLIRHGESVKVVQERLGHSSAQMTLDVYAHLWPDSDDSTREAVDAVLAIPGVSDLCHAA